MPDTWSCVSWQGMRVGQDPSAKKRKRRRGGKKRALGLGTDRQRRKDNDPLQSFEEAGAEGERDGEDEGEEAGGHEDPLEDDGDEGGEAKRRSDDVMDWGKGWASDKRCRCLLVTNCLPVWGVSRLPAGVM